MIFTSFLYLETRHDRARMTQCSKMSICNYLSLQNWSPEISPILLIMKTRFCPQVGGPPRVFIRFEGLKCQILSSWNNWVTNIGLCNCHLVLKQCSSFSQSIYPIICSNRLFKQIQSVSKTSVQVKFESCTEICVIWLEDTPNTVKQK